MWQTIRLAHPHHRRGVDTIVLDEDALCCAIGLEAACQPDKVGVGKKIGSEMLAEYTVYTDIPRSEAKVSSVLSHIRARWQSQWSTTIKSRYVAQESHREEECGRTEVGVF